MEIQGKKFLVTGGASGMGRNFTLNLAKLGGDVAFCDLNDEAIQDVEAAGADLPGKVVGFNANVASEDDVVGLITSVREALGGLDGVVNNAGIFCASDEVADMPEAEWQRSLDINLTGAMHVARESIPYLRLGWEPSLIMVGSKNVPAPGPAAGAYSVAKAGLTQLARVLALELAGDGIRVNTLHPNAVFDTAIWTDEVLKAGPRTME